MNHDVKLGNMTPEKSLTYPRRNVLAHFIGFIDYVFPELMLGDLASGELNDMFQRIPPCTYENYNIHHSKQYHVEHYRIKGS